MKECAACPAHSYDETLPNVPLSAKQCRLLSSYLLNLERGSAGVREMIVGDIDRYRDLGAHQQACDLSLVLKCFLSEFPEAREMPELCAHRHAEAPLVCAEMVDDPLG